MSDLRSLFLQSTEIKKLIVQRSTSFNIPLRYLCKKVGIEYRDFMSSYIQSDNDPNITEEQFIKLLDLLGVVVRYQIVVDKGADMDKKRIELTEWYDRSTRRIIE